MAKFIEVTERGDKTKVLINIDKIISVQEQENGLAYIEVEISPDCTCGWGVPCAESYVDVYNYLATFEFI